MLAVFISVNMHCDISPAHPLYMDQYNVHDNVQDTVFKGEAGYG